MVVPRRGPRPGLLVVGVLVVLAVIVAACAGSAEPQDELTRAVENTLGEPFSFEAVLDADRSALDSLGPEAGGMVSVLRSVQITGTRDGETSTATISALGFELVQLRTLADDERYLQLGLSQVAPLAGVDLFDPARLRAQLEATEVPPQVVDAVVAATEGRWVGVLGEIDTGRLQDAMGSEPSTEEADVREALGGDLAGFVERFVEVEETTETNGQRRLEIAVLLREIVRALGEVDPGAASEAAASEVAEVPEEIPGQVTLVDQRVQRVRVDLAPALRDAGTEVEGTLALEVEVQDAGDTEPVTAPDGAVTITGDELTEALLALSRAARDAHGDGTMDAPTPAG